MSPPIKPRSSSSPSDVKRRLVQELLGERSIGLAHAEGVPGALSSQTRPAQLPLSYAQRRLWFVDRLKGASEEYNVPESLHLRGILDYWALQRAVNTIVERHDLLRTHYEERDGEPYQVIESKLRMDIPLEDLSSLPADDQWERVRANMYAEWRRAFDLAHGPILRMRLLKLSPTEHVLTRTFHHIAFDAWSQTVFNRELMLLYEAYREGRGNPLPPLAVQYSDYALWQRRNVEVGGLEKGLAYWKTQLTGIAERLNLPTAEPRARIRSSEAAACHHTLTDAQVAAVRQLMRENHVTLQMALLAAFAVVLARHTGERDIVVGSPVANRNEPQLEQLIGLFVNPLAIRLRLRPGMTGDELLRHVRQSTLDAYEHQDVPFERIVEELAPDRSFNRTPVFQVGFAVQSTPSGMPQISGLQIEPLKRQEDLVRLDLEVHVWERDRQIEMRWLYKRELIVGWCVEQMLGHCLRVLEGMATSVEEPVDRIDLLEPADRLRVLEWSGPGVRASGATVPELFEAQARHRPDAVALVEDDRQISYAQLNAQANRLAHLLMRRKLGPGDIVGVALPRSVEQVTALLGIMKAGAAYLAVDLSLSSTWVSSMIADAGPAAVLTTPGTAEPWRSGVPLTLFDSEIVGELAGCPTTNPCDALRTSPLGPETTAYIMYTSGSTGTPKGCVVPHRGIPGFMTNVDYAPFDEHQVWLQHSSVSWDALTLELWSALAMGGRSVLYDGNVLDLHHLQEVIRCNGITTMWITSSLFNLITDAAPDVLRPLQCVFTGGETLSAVHVRRALAALKTIRLVNGYGPCECTVFACCSRIEEVSAAQSTVPIGRPVGDRRVFILDRDLQPTPIGVPGEICIGGPAVPHAYLNLPGLTAARLVPDPAAPPGNRMFRTGDMARWRPDGSIDFLGRVDNQVKIRGCRVELGEIEVALRSDPQVREAVVTMQGGGEDKQLVGYVTTAGESTVGEVDGGQAVRDRLREQLPEYMVPAAVVVLPQLPLTEHGKLDRESLPALAVDTAAYRPAQSSEEGLLCTLFAEVLETERVGVEDNFFSLGGHSLLGVRLLNRIKDRVGVTLPMRALFECPTPTQLAPVVRRTLLDEVEQLPEQEAARMAKAGPV